MGNAKIRILEDKISFLQKEAEAYKRQSYEQADLLLDLVPPLSRLGFAASADAVDAALTLARGVSKNSQDIDSIRGLADVFLRVYKKASDAGLLRAHDSGWRVALADAIAALPTDDQTIKLVAKRLRNGEALQQSLEPLSKGLNAVAKRVLLDASTGERLATMITALPLENRQLAQAAKLSARLRGQVVDMQELELILDELASLLGHALQSTMRRDQQLQGLVSQMSGELCAVEGFLGALNQRDEKSLAEAVSVQAEIGEQSTEMESFFDSSESLLEIKSLVMSRAQSIRVRLDRFVVDAKGQREQAAQDSRELADRLASLEAELKVTRDELVVAKESASHDFLTGLYNRRAFEKSMTQWLAEAEPDEKLCCVVWDIDFFKKVNDNYGHLVGDQVLKAVSGVLQGSVNDDDIVARLGGEEFVTVVRESEPETVLKWADSVRLKIAAGEHGTDRDVIAVSVSCGIAVYQRSDSLVSILARADRALYRAKDSGRNCCLVAE